MVQIALFKNLPLAFVYACGSSIFEGVRQSWGGYSFLRLENLNGIWILRQSLILYRCRRTYVKDFVSEKGSV